MIHCETHGQTHICLVCSHIVENKLNNVISKNLVTAECYFGDFGGNPDCPMTYPFTYCTKCVELHNLPKEDYVFTGTEADERFKYFSEHFKPVCGECFINFMEWD